MNKNILYNPIFLLALTIASILFVAAILKIINLPIYLRNFYLTVSIFEIILGVLLLFFFSNWKTWVLLILVFSAWAGFSFYGLIWGLPCSCLGLYTLPPGILFGIDLAIVLTGWLILSHFHLKHYKKLALFSILSFLVGILTAHLTY